MEPVRVLHVVGKMHRGGIETLLMRIYRRIDRTKLQFDFLVSTREPADYDDEIRELGGRLYYVQSRRENLFANYKGIYKILKKNPDIIAVHHHMSSCTYIEPLIIAQIAKTPLRIAHSHNTQFGGGKLHQLIHNINKKLLHFSATNYFACSKDAGNWMFGEKNWSKGQVIYNGIELEEYVYDKNKRIAVRDELELNHSFVMGYVGRFESQKNPLFICRTFAELMRRNKHIKLLLVGEGSLHSEMDKYLKQKGIINNVIYTGVVNNVSDYLQAMDCFILPSAFEGLGIVAIEAQAIGLPTLLSETIPEEAMVTELAFKLPIDQGVEIWCDKIEEIIESHQERNDMGQKIIQAGYDISQVAKTLEKFYLKRGKRE